MVDRPIRILVVDDHPTIRDSLNFLLQTEDNFLVVGTADDGLSAIELATSLRPDVILMDLSMPKMSGIDAAREILRHNKNVAVIGLSGNDDENFPGNLQDAGFATHVSKCSDLGTLISAIRTYFGRGELVAPIRVKID